MAPSSTASTRPSETLSQPPPARAVTTFGGGGSRRFEGHTPPLRCANARVTPVVPTAIKLPCVPKGQDLDATDLAREVGSLTVPPPSSQESGAR